MFRVKINISSFSTVAILSGGVRNNCLTKRIIGYLKEDEPNLNFIGIAGTNCDTHFKTIYAYSDGFPKQPFEATNHYKQSLQQWQFSPYMLPVHMQNKKILQKIEKGNIYEDLVNQRVSAIINVGNWSFSRLFLQKVNEIYQKKKILKPPVFLYDRSIFNRRIEHQQILDYQFYQLPREPDNFGNYRFPSMCIGYEAVFKIYTYLAKYKKDHTFDYKQKNNFSEETEVLIQAERTQFRNRIGVGQDVFVIAVAPGKSQDQIDFTMARLPDTIKKFFQSNEMKSYPIEKFQLWIVPPRDRKNLNLDVPLSLLPNLKIRYIQTLDRIPSLCSSDVAIVHNGEVTVEAAVCHLPTIIIDNRSMPQAYLSYLFNRFESPLNITTQRMGYQQLLSNDSAVPQKLSTLLVDHFVNPKLKFFYIDTYEKALKAMLRKSERNPTLNVEETGLETSCQMVISEIKAYESRDHGKTSRDWRTRRLTTFSS